MKVSQSLSRFWLDPIMMIGLLISISIGLVMVLTGNDSISGLIVGLLSTIVTLLVDIIARIEASKANILEANSLASIFSDERLGNSLRDIANSYDTIKNYEFDHFVKLADARITECKTYNQELASGSIYSPAKSIYEYSAYTAFDKATQTIRAIDKGPVTFWNTERGRKYLKVNRAAAKRGVKITRLFALTSEDARKHIEILEEQAAAGVKVIIVTPSRIEKEFLVIDGKIRIDIESDQEGSYLGERIIIEPTQVADAIERFDLMTSFGKTLKDTTYLLP